MKRKLRLTIRATLLLMTLIAILFAVFMSRLRARRTALLTVTSVGGIYSASATDEPEWLQRFLNDDEYFREIRTIHLGPNTVNSDATRPAGDAELTAVIDSLPDPNNLKRLNLYASSVSDDGLSHFKEMTNLKEVSLKKTEVTSEGVGKLQRMLPSCTICTD